MDAMDFLIDNMSKLQNDNINLLKNHNEKIQEINDTLKALQKYDDSILMYARKEFDTMVEEAKIIVEFGSKKPVKV